MCAGERGRPSGDRRIGASTYGHLVTKVFVSHANADKDVVNVFVANVLRIGCGLDATTLFYSSERDTGVRSGANLLQTVRDEVDAATLVIALITPMYQERPVCIAEMGAAWGRSGSDRFFPLVAPTLDRNALEGIIPSTLCERWDDSVALDELFDRVKHALGKEMTTAQWGVGKLKWLSFLQSNEAELQLPDRPSEAQHAKLKKELQDTAEALEYTQGEVRELQRQVTELASAKDASDVAEILLPKGARERFKSLLDQVESELTGLPAIVKEALYQDNRGSFVTRPSFDDPDWADAMNDAIERELLSEDDDGIALNLEKRKVRNAAEAIRSLDDFFDTQGVDSEFGEWFEDQYAASPRLSDRDCWEALFR